MRVYLAGPDVFLPDPHGRAALLKALCAQHGLIGVSPMDKITPEPVRWAGLPEAFRIARQNEAHIASCDVLVANLTPFRGPSADVGTVFELGLMRALGRPVFGWSNAAAQYAARTRAFLGTDGDGLEIEDFGLSDNLMIEGAIHASGGAMEVDEGPHETRWTRLAAFMRCLTHVAALPAPADRPGFRP
jgi:nucleoside 2-deoxyribosyltransferase